MLTESARLEELLQHSRKVPERSSIADPKAERSEG
jgi:hypothetical protein